MFDRAVIVQCRLDRATHEHTTCMREEHTNTLTSHGVRRPDSAENVPGSQGVHKLWPSLQPHNELQYTTKTNTNIHANEESRAASITRGHSQCNLSATRLAFETRGFASRVLQSTKESCSSDCDISKLTTETDSAAECLANSGAKTTVRT